MCPPMMGDGRSDTLWRLHVLRCDGSLPKPGVGRLPWWTHSSHHPGIAGGGTFACARHTPRAIGTVRLTKGDEGLSNGGEVQVQRASCPASAFVPMAVAGTMPVLHTPCVLPVLPEPLSQQQVLGSPQQRARPPLQHDYLAAAARSPHVQFEWVPVRKGVPPCMRSPQLEWSPSASPARDPTLLHICTHTPGG
jgi:hypothetical protein